MGGAIQYVYRDGQRLTPWMLYCINRFSDALFARFGVHIRVSSGIRTHQEQVDIFLRRYTTNPGGRKVYDTRVWQGRRYYRIDPAGTVAVPRTSNHEIQGSRGAADLADTGKDAGIATGNNPRANWARANAHLYGLRPEGYNFREPWHFSIDNIFTNPPAAPAGGNSRPVPEEDDMFTDEDRKMLREAHEAAMWSKARIGGSTKGASLTDQVVNGVKGLNAGIQWLKDRVGGSTKTSPSIADELRNARPKDRG